MVPPHSLSDCIIDPSREPGGRCPTGMAGVLLHGAVKIPAGTSAWRIMARRVPRSSCLWSGTTTWENGSSRRTTRWLPFWRTTRKPTRSRMAIHSLPDSCGKPLIPLPAGPRIARLAPSDALPPRLRCRPGCLPDMNNRLLFCPPRLIQPGRLGHSATQKPSSPG